MIKSISIRNCASYDQEGCDISTLQKINMIYGGNGTGIPYYRSHQTLGM